jgi:hypothetical protein
MANKTGYNQHSGPKYNKKQILKLVENIQGRKKFRKSGLRDMAIREGILEECHRIVDKNQQDYEQRVSEQKRNEIDKILPTIKSKSDFRLKYPKLCYYARYHYKEVFDQIISQKYSTQQLICKVILENLIGASCVYNNRSTLNGKELDIIFPLQKIACEYNSFFWHEHRSNDDKIKALECEKLGIYLIVVKEPHLNAYNTISNSIEGIKNQIISHLDEINKHTLDIKTKNDVKEIQIIGDNLLEGSYSQVDIDYIVNHCNRYSEVKTKHNKIWQYLLRNKLLHVLDPVKKRDYIYMDKSEILKYVEENFLTYTDFVQHKSYQLVRTRGFLQDVKNLYL